jgi:hypothetical protein
LEPFKDLFSILAPDITHLAPDFNWVLGHILPKSDIWLPVYPGLVSPKNDEMAALSILQFRPGFKAWHHPATNFILIFV